jgi:RNA polymerase sigma-70 factor (ECF subfamily)
VEVTLQEPEPWIVAAAKRGDLIAFETLVRMYQPYVWRLCLHLLGDEQAASDATQNAFLKAFRAMKRFKGESRFSTWLISVARNSALDEGRGRNRRDRLARAAKDEARVAQRSTDPRSSMEIRDALNRLPLELREATVLIDMLGFSYREASETLGIKEGTLKSRVHRAREALMTLLTDPQEDVREG